MTFTITFSDVLMVLCWVSFAVSAWAIVYSIYTIGYVQGESAEFNRLFKRITDLQSRLEKAQLAKSKKKR